MSTVSQTGIGRARERERESMRIRQCVTERERESRHPRKEGGRLVVFVFPTQGMEMEEDRPRQTTPLDLRREARFFAAACVSALP